MTQEASLSTRIETPCRCCAGSYRLVEKTDALAMRPVSVEVFCPDCGHTAFITLLESGRFRPSSSSSMRPSASQSLAPSLTPGPGSRPTFDGGLRAPRVPGAAASGLNLASRYSIRAPAFDVEERAPSSAPEPPNSKRSA